VLQAFATSDIGRGRSTNQDAFVADTSIRLFAVADGMGGHGGGDVASRLAIEAISAYIRDSVGPDGNLWPFGIDRRLSPEANRLRTAIQLANRTIFNASRSNIDYNGMGTTIVAALVAGSRVVVGHVGDSRAYWIGDGRIEQLTKDDSWAAGVLANDPRLGPADIAKHPMRNVLTNAVGVREIVEVHLGERDLRDGDMLLLCSDGLHGVLDEKAIGAILAGAAAAEAGARRLVAGALERGTRDNVTALVVRYGRNIEGGTGRTQSDGAEA
jgi:serine/threonine protein phosphatase PrpC